MGYFVTGATGFIGRNLVELLLEREGTIYVLVREGSKGRLEELRNRWGVDEERIVGIVGDLSEARLGVSDEDLGPLQGDVEHLFHLAAIYDMTASAERQRVANVEGTRHMVQFAEAVEAGHVHMVSSIAAAGLYRGTWREDMFEEAPGARHPPLLPDQARVRGRRPQRVLAPVARLPPRDRRRQLRDRRDGQGRRARTTSSSSSAGSAARCPSGCRCRGSRAARSTSSRSTSWSRRWTTSPTRRDSTDAPSASPTRIRSPPVR